MAANRIQIHGAALKFPYVKALKPQWFEDRVARGRRRPKLRTELCAEEITRILDRTINLKHWTMTATLLCDGAAV